MLRLPDRQTALRRGFLTAGWVLLWCQDLVIRSMYSTTLVMRIGLLVVVGFCFFTAWGMKRQRAWSRWTGIAACALLLAGTPWLTIFGASGLILMLAWSPPSVPSSEAEDYWKPGRQSLLGAILQPVTFLATLQIGGAYFNRWARQMNLPHPFDHFNSGFLAISTVAALFGGFFLHAAVHEAGHALAAWIVGYRLEVWNAGPLTIYRTPKGWRTHLNWKQLLGSGGYMGAAPTSEDSARVKEIFVIAAGPLTSLTAAMGLTLWFFELPGSFFAPFWRHIFIVAAIGYHAVLANLIPTGGYSDGTMLFHLIFRTKRGDELLDAILSRHRLQEAGRRQLVGDSSSALQVRRAALDRLMKSRRSHPAQLAKAHSQLGLAELSSGAHRSAEASFRRGLSALPPAGDPAIEAECHLGLHRICLLQNRAADGDAAYRAATRALEQQIKPGAPGSLLIAIQLVELHTHARQFERALEQIGPALARLSDSPRNLRARALLLRSRGHCELQLGHRERGVASLEQAVDLWCSRGSQLADAPKQLSSIAVDFWRGGQAEPAIALLRDAVALLEGRGELRVAAQKRILLADCLHRDGQIAEAEQALPDPALLDEQRRRSFVLQRAEVHQKAGRMAQALDDYQEVLRLVRADPEACTGDIATAQYTVAEASLDLGNIDEAEGLVLEAWETLSAAGHPNAVSCCVTLAIVSSRKQRDPQPWVDEGLRRMEDSPLLTRGNQARSLDAAADRLEKAGLSDGAARYRAAADAHWQFLGVPRKTAAYAHAV